MSKSKSKSHRPSILVTGGSRGIGAATVRLALERDYRVYCTYLTADPSGIPADATAIQTDLASEASIVELFHQIEGPLDAVVNNAATLETQMRLDAMDAARMHRIFAVNAIGPMLVAREAVRRMSSAGGGAIVNVSSGAAKYGSPGEYVDYAASKGALETFTIGLAREVAAEGIRVNAVRPGFIYTDLHAKGGEPGRVDRVKSQVPMQRGGQPEEVATAILWLLSEEASYVTGTILDVAGGR